MELGDNATYPIIGMGLISSCMPIGDVLDPDDVLCVLVSIEDILSVATKLNLRCMAEFDDQQVIIGDCNRGHDHILAKGMQESSL